MQEYAFVSVALLRHRDGLEFDRDYQEAIRAHALDGWEFVQAIPLEALPQPRLDLVFTRKVTK